MLKINMKSNTLKRMACFAAVMGLCFAAAVCYMRLYLYDNHDDQVHIGAISFYWEHFMTALTIGTAIVLAIAAYLAPTRFKYLYIGLVIGYFIFSPSHSYLFDYIAGYEILPEMGITYDMEEF